MDLVKEMETWNVIRYRILPLRSMKTFKRRLVLRLRLSHKASFRIKEFDLDFAIPLTRKQHLQLHRNQITDEYITYLNEMDDSWTSLSLYIWRQFEFS